MFFSIFLDFGRGVLPARPSKACSGRRASYSRIRASTLISCKDFHTACKWPPAKISMLSALWKGDVVNTSLWDWTRGDTESPGSQICTKAPSRTADSNQLTSELSHHESPSWSPDGNQIIFSKQDGRNNKIYAMMKDGSFQRRLFSFSGSETYPRWAYNY